jgi:radical SAM/SPASM domain protein of ACGX system
MRDEPTYKNELRNELGFENCLKVLDDFIHTTKEWGTRGSIHFTGGDPLLKPEIFELIKHAADSGLSVGILGNPNLLTRKVATKLKDNGLVRYQVSIDGMEETHDRLRRRKGLFQDTLRAIQILNEVGIRSVVMFTLSRVNAGELIDVIRLVSKEKVSAFDFARLVPVGSGTQLRKQMVSPHEYRSLLLKVLDEYSNLQEEGSGTRFGRKDHLWKLLYYELGLFKRPQEEKQNLVYDGCAIGNRTVSVLADGTVYACRRLPVTIGKVPNKSIRDIFINSEELNKMRVIEEMKKCKQCELLNYCRGCPAVAYGISGNYYSADPQCWKEVSTR